MELEEMEKRLNIAKQEIYNLEEDIRQLKEEKQQGRWKPELNQEYYAIDYEGEIGKVVSSNEDGVKSIFEIGNAFRTKKEAQSRADRIKIYWQLYDLAEKLNKGEKIDWQDKYCINYDNFENCLDYDCHCTYQGIGQIYCLDKHFLDKAIEEIGEDNLKKLFEEE